MSYTPTVASEHGFALVLSGGLTGTFLITNVSPLSETLPKINISHHGTTTKVRTMPGDLYEEGDIEFDLLFEGQTGLPSLNRVIGDFTLTFPRAQNHSTAGFLSGSGYVLDRQWPGGASGGTNPLTGKFKLTPDGYSGPSYTAAA